MPSWLWRTATPRGVSDLALFCSPRMRHDLTAPMCSGLTRRIFCICGARDGVGWDDTWDGMRHGMVWDWIIWGAIETDRTGLYYIWDGMYMGWSGK